ncbi:MAG TPA: tetratricopeptide repeat protein [Magnetospirillum sp.]|nr:tetratricopeptide repeat protein [Magnetospirillum sp.]
MQTVHQLVQAGQFQPARDRLRDIVNAAPRDLDARRLLGKLELHLGNAEPAFALLSSVAQSCPSAAEVAFEAGVAALACGKLEVAQGLFRTELETSPHHPGALFNLSWAMRRLGQTLEAIEVLRQLVAVATQNVDAWFNLGNTLSDAGQLDEAVEAFARARMLAPERPDIALNLAIVCHRKGDAGQAEDMLRGLHHSGAQDGRALSLLGRILVESGRAAEAKALLERHQAAAYQAEVAIALAATLRSLNQLPEARGELVRALEAVPGNSWGWQLLALVSMELADYAGADAALSRGRALDASVGLGEHFSAPEHLWRLHPQAELFLARGGDTVAPPRHVGLALTNKCNLRCDICGSQGNLDATGSLRKHMPIEMFRTVAEAIFPTAAIVELNSRGEPLFYPHIDEVLDTIRRHRCLLKLQTNGTMFTDAVIDRLTGMNAIINVSIDAVGPVFDEVRLNGKWAQVEPQMRKLAARCDPARHAIQLYPTVTARTAPCMLELVQWAADCGIPYIEFHPYIVNSFAKVDKPAEVAVVEAQLAAIRAWATSAGSGICVTYDGERITDGKFPEVGMPSFIKQSLYSSTVERPAELSVANSHPTRLCSAPFDTIDIGLFGEVSACCRSSLDVLGTIDSVERFAAIWLGPNYACIRKSLLRDATGPLPLPSCVDCVGFYTPETAKRRAGTASLPGQGALECRDEAIPVACTGRLNLTDPIHVAGAPVGLRVEDYRLFEDGVPLAVGVRSLDDVRATLGGAWTVHGRQLCFTSSDGSDPQRNDRTYALRRIP